MKKTKTDLVAKYADRLGTSRAAASKAFDELFALLSDELAEGNSVTIPNFGSFEPKTRGARTGRNPRTKAPMLIAPCKYPAYRASKVLKSRLN